MKNLLAVLIVILLANSCREDLITESTVIDDPIPTNTYVYEFGVFGLVVDEDGDALEEATVTISRVIELTDENGYFEFEAVDGTEDGIYILAEKEGYVDGGVLLVPNGENDQQVRIVLVKDNSSTLLSNSSGGVLSLQNGAEVIIPNNAFDVSGDVNVNAHFIPNTRENFHEVYPSALVGKNQDDELKYLNSIGAVVVEFTDDQGNKLNLKNGIEVILKLPIPNDAYSWPDEINLWSLNESTGYWEAESTAKKVGEFYEGTVEHFSWWSASDPVDLVDVCFTIVDESGKAVPNIEVLFLSWYTGYIQSGFTDSDGGLCTKLGEGDENILLIVDECFSTLHDEIYSASPEETSKEIVVSSLPIQARFEGTISACDGSEVEDGYLSFDLGYDKKVVQIEDGKYSFSSYCGYDDRSVEVLAVDKSDFSSSMLTIDLDARETVYQRDIILCETLETFMQYKNVTEGNEVILGDCKALRNPSETLIVAMDAEVSSDNILLGVEGFEIGEFGTSLLGLRTQTALPETFQTTFTKYQNVGGYVEGTFIGVTDDGDKIEGQFKAIRTK